MTTFKIALGLLFLTFLPTYSLGQPNPRTARVLIYSATTGFRHDSIPTAIESLKSKSALADVIFDATEDRAQFRDSILNRYDAVMFLSNTGEGMFSVDLARHSTLIALLVLDNAGKVAFQKYLNSGGNFVGVHSASDCLVNTTFFGREIGALWLYL
jgi:hypothetical protein